MSLQKIVATFFFF